MAGGRPLTSCLQLRQLCRHHTRPAALCRRRNASSAAAAAVEVPNEDIEDLEQESSFSAAPPSADVIQNYDPIARARSRTTQLPPSRYRFRPPKYYRGPLHPYQSPRPSDPASRLFVPGPFTLPRLQQTYDTTIASDLMTLMYTHYPPGTSPSPVTSRLRAWEGESPYYKNRPLRPPRGGDGLRPLRKPITFRNIPRLTGVTVHTMVRDALEDSAHLHVAGMVLQSITNVRVTTHKSRKNVPGWGLKTRRSVAVTARLKGEDVYHFLSKCIDIVLPRIKDWKGVQTSSGDMCGNITFGLSAETVAMFPEIEVNYDMYPPKMIPGCHITVHTSAKDDRDARMLLNAIGLPFFGKIKY